MTQTKPTVHLTPQQIVQYHREGFLILESITTPEDVELIREMLDGLFDRYEQLPKDLTVDLGEEIGHKGKLRSPQINNPIQLEPRLAETLYYRNAMHVAEQLLGEGVRNSWNHAILKPPHNGRATPWHQDLAYPARSSNDPNILRFGCNFWMPLQKATVESGCMQFIPYSHLSNLRPHFPAGHNPNNYTLETDEVDPRLAVAGPIPAGGCTIHSPKTLHYTAPNDTDVPRRTFILNIAHPLK